MRSFWAALCTGLVIAFFPILQQLAAQGRAGSSPLSTIHATSSLVILDVTVLDKHDHPVAKGLTTDDFTITENQQPQRIFSFEPPEAHMAGANAGEGSAVGKAPVSIIVLDVLNSNLQEFGYIRHAVSRFLQAQPTPLKSPAELLVLGNHSLKMLQGYTTSKQDLIDALNDLPPAMPYKLSNDFAWQMERFGQSYDALVQIALFTRSMPGRKNVIWVGPGSPGIAASNLPPELAVRVRRYVHETVNRLVDARISLFVIHPDLKVDFTKPLFANRWLSAMNEVVNPETGDPRSGDFNFGMFVSETGGKLYYNRNDVDGEIARSQQMGSMYYTLSYQPPQGDADGRFRQIRVTLRDPNLHAVTKNGYFAPDSRASPDPHWQAKMSLYEAAVSTLPYTALNLKIAGITRPPDARTAILTLQLKPQDLVWRKTEDGKSSIDLIVAGVCLNGRRDVLSSNVEEITLQVNTQDSNRLANLVLNPKLPLTIPHRTASVRVVIENQTGGQMGAAEVDRTTLDDASSPPAPYRKPGTDTSISF